MAGPLYLADSNILLRLVKRDHPQYPLVRGAVNTLRQTGVRLSYTLQNMAEFWNASTRNPDPAAEVHSLAVVARQVIPGADGIKGGIANAIAGNYWSTIPPFAFRARRVFRATGI